MSGRNAKDYYQVSSRRQRRRLSAAARLLELMGKDGYTPERMEKMEAEAKNLHDRLNGIKKKRKEKPLKKKK